MRTSRIALGLALLLGGVSIFLSSSDDSDRAAVERLTRIEKERANVESEPGASDPPEMIRLTDRLVAARSGGQDDHWTVEDGTSAASVELPFAPNDTGALPIDSYAAASKSGEHSISNPGFMGADVCAECHLDRHDGFIHTAHYKTSGSVDPDHPIGHFHEPLNELKTPDESLRFRMRQRDGRRFQQVLFADWSIDIPLDVFTGSAKAGQTFLYWHGDALFQSHVSYLTHSDEWIASPGYQETSAIYTRVIRPECLECHITYIDRQQKPNVYHRESAIWGISCERCHGPGRDHVEFHRQHPEASVGKQIVNPADLPRPRQLDICGQCHSGSFFFVDDAFSFRPGDKLADYHQLYDEQASGVGGIHTANQLKRLQMSQCFQQSEMTCTTCHDPHQHQRGDMTVFTKRCLSCHQPAACGMSQHLGERIADNCVSCHMPIGDNEGMTMQVSQGQFTVKMIDHYIRVDQDASDRYQRSLSTDDR